ncbi:peptidoglycan/xylan/chitin deacetylase (PgdA/CDA1 family) [Wenyingzhuangia heitensis]|uniref:Peptidoglycan/xylan/chitin deacetylase (PgdA/CDA1 family) n=1 Tax=Wenyingzhuangia heitensis TaxID=1487859 RepID=A0ABX0U7N1_9FLAO|nr:polysaccharide deacetylase family protein [Wenyingzhuangia heitensis]NIJ44817.1 peptidoglycan/xylan/chitin deacetylase (PgdA/CDA1 family) [Wenyingzhuangia heitensis]
MRLYPVKTISIFKSIFNKWIWSFDTDKKEIYLTFDDGPIPTTTPWVLEQLSMYNAKATFFCIGDNIRKYPRIFNQITNKGHRVGNHTFNHLKGWKTNTNVYIQNVLKAEKKLETHNNPKIFRPPYGKITNTQSKKLRKLGYQIIMWDVLSADFDQQLTAKNCTENVLKNVKNGSIIVFHDSQKAYPRLKETLPKVLEELSKKGFLFKVIP